MNYNYKDGRFFISPIIGCYGQCVYCYLSTKIKDRHPRQNNYSIEFLIENMKLDKNFNQGRNGSIISVGAWGDIFARENDINFSVEYIKKLLLIGNPVQIMSKFSLTESQVKSICNNIQYPNQLLYSTTITTFQYWESIEYGTIDPIYRLKTAHLFKKYGGITNVMIKPCIIGITDSEYISFIENMKKYEIDYCVVGIMYWNEQIKEKIQLAFDKLLLTNNTIYETHKEIMDCSSDIKLDTFSSKATDKFINSLKSNGIKAFKKSSCVNANILNVNNISNYFVNDPNSYCTKCGNCK